MFIYTETHGSPQARDICPRGAVEEFQQGGGGAAYGTTAVSIAVRKLEESLETILFDRSGRRVELTAEGQNLLNQAQGILRDVDKLTNSVSAMNKLLTGELTIACPSMLATYFLPDLLSGFLALHPGLKASVTQAGTTRVEQMILQDEIEIGRNHFHGLARTGATGYR